MNDLRKERTVRSSVPHSVEVISMGSQIVNWGLLLSSRDIKEYARLALETEGFKILKASLLRGRIKPEYASAYRCDGYNWPFLDELKPMFILDLKRKDEEGVRSYKALFPIEGSEIYVFPSAAVETAKTLGWTSRLWYWAVPNQNLYIQVIGIGNMLMTIDQYGGQ